MVTGHRPQGLNQAQRIYIKAVLPAIVEELAKDYRVDTLLSGMAQGVDLIWAGIARQSSLQLEAYIPFPDQTKGWDTEWVNYREGLMDYASFIHQASNYYATWAFHKRNDMMLDDCDVVVAVWDPRRRGGGTASVVRKARERGKPLVVVDLEKWSISDNFSTHPILGT